MSGRVRVRKLHFHYNSSSLENMDDFVPIQSVFIEIFVVPKVLAA